MKILALTSVTIVLSIPALLGDAQSKIDFLLSRVDAHESRISQLEEKVQSLQSSPTSASLSETTSKVPSLKQKTGNYIVKKGDTLSTIAQRSGTTVTEIKKRNRLKNDYILVGQRLDLGQRHMDDQLISYKSEPYKHKVKSGETLSSIARDHKVSLENVLAANPKVHPKKLQIGQVVIIDGTAKLAQSNQNKKSSKKTVANKKSSTSKSSPAPRAHIPDPVVDIVTVNEPISYAQFASKHGATTTQINELNGLSLSKNTMLAKGSELYVPRR